MVVLLVGIIWVRGCFKRKVEVAQTGHPRVAEGLNKAVDELEAKLAVSRYEKEDFSESKVDQHENNHESYHVFNNLNDHTDQVVKAVPHTKIKEELAPKQNDAKCLKSNQPGVRCIRTFIM